MSILQGYVFKAGRPISGHLVVEVLLADENPGDGGVCVVAGSHKSALAAPEALKAAEHWSDYITEVHGKAGDAIVFPECTLHGALPWKGRHQRRTLLYRFNAGHAAYSESIDAGTDEYPEWVRRMTPAQQRVLSRPGFLGWRQEEAAAKLEQARQAVSTSKL